MTKQHPSRWCHKTVTLPPLHRREIERPIAIGNLKIKAHIGKLCPAGKVGAGRGNKISYDTGGFNKNTLTAYRKLAKAAEKLDDYYQTTVEGH